MEQLLERFRHLETWLIQYLSPSSDSAPADGRQSDWWIPRRHLAWLCLFAALFAIQISPFWYATPDGSTYFGLARHAFSSQPFAQPGDPGSVAPPGYAFLISPAFLSGERPFLMISLIQFGFSVALLFGVYVWIRRIFPDVALLLTGLALLNMSVWFHYRRTLKEIAFMSLAIWLVLLMNHVRKCRKYQIPISLVASGLMCLIVLTRFSGILFAAGFGLSMLLGVWRRELSWTIAVGLTLLVGLPASGLIVHRMQQETRQYQHHGGPSYQKGFEEAAERGSEQLLSGSRHWISSIGRVMVPGLFKADVKTWTDANMLIHTLTLGIVLAGWWSIARTGEVFALTFPLYIGLHIVWPYDQGGRFAVPLLPILVVCYWANTRRWIPCPRAVCAAALILHAGVGLGYWLTVDAPRALAAHQRWAFIDQVAASIDEGEVQCWKVGELESPMLQIALDRPVHQTDSEQIAVIQTVQWLVIPAGIREVPDFTRHDTIGDLAVWKSAPQTAPPRTASSAGERQY